MRRRRLNAYLSICLERDFVPLCSGIRTVLLLTRFSPEGRIFFESLSKTSPILRENHANGRVCFKSRSKGSFVDFSSRGSRTSKVFYSTTRKIIPRSTFLVSTIRSPRLFFLPLIVKENRTLFYRFPLLVRFGPNRYKRRKFRFFFIWFYIYSV